ncbi:hypothetical protein AVEN_83005-1 [Araneus ventricosus]|uniref:Uncharacterized protein n=1 Tax=Araneus ventricosus TaxID=182803 RepID=A0A4Y2GPD3_ARAVE|nr:hypothetical protein AVEN_83005-1 [Araneus ventricosus]
MLLPCVRVIYEKAVEDLIILGKVRVEDVIKRVGLRELPCGFLIESLPYIQENTTSVMFDIKSVYNFVGNTKKLMSTTVSFFKDELFIRNDILIIAVLIYSF